MKQADKIRWGTERRLEFIEFRLHWEGGVRRGDLTEAFGISTPQASGDLTLYQDLAPGNMMYDSSEKKYVATAEFKAKYCDVSAERYLAHLRDWAGERLNIADSWMSQVPAAETMPLPARRLNTEVVKKTVSAVRRKRSLEIAYRSLTSEGAELSWRQVSPHAFAFDGTRWHVRAFCHRDHKFKDFVLSRFTDAREGGEPGVNPEKDHLWNTRVDVVLQANPRLKPHQRAAIEEDYAMAEHVLVLSMRKALLFYLEKHLRLDYPDESMPPEAKPLCAVNPEVFSRLEA